MTALLAAVAVVTLLAVLVMAWPVRKRPAGLRRPPDDPAGQVERQFAEAVESMRLEEAERLARRWFELADDRDSRRHHEAGDRRGGRSAPPAGSWHPAWPPWWV